MKKRSFSPFDTKPKKVVKKKPKFKYLTPEEDALLMAASDDGLKF